MSCKVGHVCGTACRLQDISICSPIQICKSELGKGETQQNSSMIGEVSDKTILALTLDRSGCGAGHGRNMLALDRNMLFPFHLFATNEWVRGERWEVRRDEMKIFLSRSISKTSIDKRQTVRH